MSPLVWYLSVSAAVTRHNSHVEYDAQWRRRDMQWSLKYGFSVETGRDTDSPSSTAWCGDKRQVQLYGVRYDLSVVQVRLYVRTLSNIRVARVIGSNYGLVHCGALTKPSTQQQHRMAMGHAHGARTPRPGGRSKTVARYANPIRTRMCCAHFA